MSFARRAVTVGLLLASVLLLVVPLASASAEIRHEILEPYAEGYESGWTVNGPLDAWEAVDHKEATSSYISSSTKGRLQVVRLGKGGTEWKYKHGWTIKKVTVKFIGVTAKAEGAEVGALSDQSAPKTYLPTTLSTGSLSASSWASLEQTDWEKGGTYYPFQTYFGELKASASKVYGTWAEVEVEVPEPKFTIATEQRLAGESSYTKAELSAEAGRKVEYLITVENTGTDALEFGALKDAKCTTIVPSGETTLANGAKETFKCEHVLSSGDETPYKDTASIVGHTASTSATGKEETSNTVQTAITVPSFTISKKQRLKGESSYTSAPLEAEIGQTAEYQIAVKNTGEAPIRFKPLKDERCTAISPSGETELLAAESETFTCEHTFSEAGTVYTNIASVEGAGHEKASEPVEIDVVMRQAVAFGKNHFGQLGVGFLTHSSGTTEGEEIEEGEGEGGYQYEPSPIKIPAAGEVVEVAQGFKFGVALLRNGEVETWGRDEKGQLGYNVAPKQKYNEQWGNDEPGLVPGLKGVKQVAAASLHAIALLENGKVMTWGISEHGEDGNGTAGMQGYNEFRKHEEEVQQPEPVEAKIKAVAGEGVTVTAVAAGGQDDYALLSNGEVAVWGGINNGVLTTDQSNAEQEKEEAEKAICGSGLSGGEEKPGETEEEKAESTKKKAERRWYNGYQKGECSHLCFVEVGGVAPCAPEPVLVEVFVKEGKKEEKHPLAHVAKVAASEESAYALTEAGQLLGWGNDQEGQLGTGEHANSKIKSPVAVKEFGEKGTHIVELATGSGSNDGGGQSILARLSNGRVYGWGNDHLHQIGVEPVCYPKTKESAGAECEQCANNTDCVPTPTEIPGLVEHGTVERIFEGGKDSFALINEGGFKGRLYAWGQNGCGQLGIGTGSLGCDLLGEGEVDTPTPSPSNYHFAQVSASEDETNAVLAEDRNIPPSFTASTPEKPAASVLTTWTFPLSEHPTKPEEEHYRLRICNQERAAECNSTPVAEANVTAAHNEYLFEGVPANNVEHTTRKGSPLPACSPPSPGFSANVGKNPEIEHDVAGCYEVSIETLVNGLNRERIIPDFTG